MVFHLEIFSSTVLHLSLSNLPLGFRTVECNVHTQKNPKTDHEGMSSLEFGPSVTGCQLATASSNSSIQTISAAFSFPTCLQNLPVCVFNITRSCYNLASMCAHQNVYHVSMKTGKYFTLLNHSSSWVCVWILCGICVKDICEGQDYGICEGRYTQWGGWMKMQEELRKKCLNYRGH